MTEPPTGPSAASGGRSTRAWLRGTFSAVILVSLACRIDWNQVADAFRGLLWSSWIAALAVHVLAQGLSALRWQGLARPLGFDAPLRRFTGLYFVGMFFNLLLPTSIGGDAVRAAYLNAGSGRRMAAFLSVFLDRLSGLLVLVALAGVAALVSPVALPIWVQMAVGGAAVGALGGLVLLPAGLRVLRRLDVAGRGRAHKLLTKFRRLAESLREALAIYRRSPRLLAGSTALSVLVQGAGVVTVALLGRSIGVSAPLAVYGVAVPMVALLTLLPVSLNGMGVREAGMVLFLQPAGVPAGQAVTIAFLWFCVQTAAGLAGAGVYLLGHFPRRRCGMTMLSVIVPIKDERDNLGPLHDQLTAVLRPLGWDYEVVFVDDGSADDSFQILDDLAARDGRVKVVRLRRNYGQTAALLAGIDLSHGDILVTMDGDLQNDPADIPALVAKLQDGFDVVLGKRANRQDAFLIRMLPSLAANWLIRKVTGIPFKDFGCTLRAMRRDVAESLPLYGEMHRFVPALALQHGARLTQIPVRHHPRRAGHTKYNLTRTVRVLLDLITVSFLSRYLTRPMHFLGTVGLTLIGLGGLSFLATVIMKWAQGIFWTGNPFLLLSVMLELMGMQFILMGLLGEVLSRTYFESQGKTPYSVRTTRNLDRQPRQAA